MTITEDRSRRAGTVVRCRGGRYYIRITGRLTRGDVRHLLHACGRALEQRPPPLEIQVADRAELDTGAIFVLERLRALGAVVTGLPDRNGPSPAP